MYKAEILALKDMGEGLLITSGGREFQMGIISMKKRVFIGIGFGIRSKNHLTMRVLQMRIGVRGEN